MPTVQSILDALPQHVALLDQQGTIITTNAAWDRNTHAGYLVGCDDADTARAAQGIHEVISGARDSFVMEYPCAQRVFLMRVTPVEEAGPACVMLTHEDITEARTHSQEHLRAITTHIADAIIIVDTRGIIQFVNPAAEDLLEHSAAELLGTSLGFPIARDTVELNIVRKGSTMIYAEMRVTEIPWQGRTAYLASLRNVTERKESEVALKQYVQEQAALYAITSAIAGVLDLDELVNTVLDVVLPVLGTRQGWILLSDGAVPRLAATRGLPPTFDIDQAVCASVRCQFYTALTNDSATDIDLGLVTCPANWHHPTQIPFTHACIPLRAGTRLLGILNFADYQPDFDLQLKRDLWLTISTQVGMALNNAQLYQSARQVDRLRILNDLDHALSTSLDPDTVIQVTLNQIATALNAPLGLILMLSDDPHVYTLSQGWLTLEPTDDDMQQLQRLLAQFDDERDSYPFPEEEFTLFSAYSDLAARWGAQGLIVPLRANNRLEAVMGLGGRPFSDDDRAVIRAAASRAGQALVNASLYHASQEQSDRLATLNTISTAAVSSLDLHTVLRLMLTRTREALDARHGAILLLDPDTTDLVITSVSGKGIDMLETMRIDARNSLAGWAMQRRQGVRLDRALQDTPFTDWMGLATGSDTHSLICAPLIYHDRVIGAMEIVNKRGGQFNARDLELIEAISPIAAMAIENARLYTTTLSRADDLALFNEIGLTLTRTLDYSTVVQDALEVMQRLFQAQNIALLRLDADTQMLYVERALLRGQPVDCLEPFGPGEGIASLVIEQMQPLLVENVQTHPRWTTYLCDYLEDAAGTLIAVPLYTPEHVIGVIEVISDQPGAYTEDTLQTLRAIASTITIALENARLYEDMKTLLRERKQAQEQLIHSEKMIALGRLVASIAHEINNPLQAILGCLTLFKEEMAGQQRRDKMDRYLEIVESEIQRIAIILRRMRDFHRPAHQELRPTDIHSVLNSVLELVGKQLQHSGVVVDQQWSRQIPTIQANPDHLRQVFLNLVLNAIDAMPQGGHLRINTGLQADSVWIEFTDTGEGMSPEVLAHLFEPFFTTKESGSGLGLSITYRIIETHGGQIKVKSASGAGTTFIITLPRENVAAKEIGRIYG